MFLLIKCSSSITFTVDSHYNDTEECLVSEGRVPCKSLEYIASNTEEKHNISIKVISPVIHMSGTAYFYNITGITIAGNEQAMIHILCEAGSKDGAMSTSIGSSLVFNTTRNITLYKLKLGNCTGEKKFFEILYHFAVLIINSTEIQLINVSISNSSGYGLIFINDQKDISITGSEFSFNYNKDASFPYHSGGMLILNNHNNLPATYNISQVTFKENAGSSKNLSKQSRGQGGGLHIMSISSNDSRILLSNVSFTNNTEYFGGGLFTLYSERSSNNTLRVIDSTFSDNMAYNGGAGSNVGFEKSETTKEKPSKNTVSFINCEWEENHARMYGGGVAIFASPMPMDMQQDHNTDLNRVVFNRCRFMNNYSSRGAAINLSPTLRRTGGWDLLVQVKIEQCTFDENYAYNQQNKKATNGGIVLSSYFQLIITGINIFNSNLGTALLLLSKTVTFSNSNITFYNNTAERGGGIYLMRKSFIELKGNNSLTFEENTALFGGAIMATQLHEHDFQYLDSCFLIGERQKSKFIFQNNIALSSIGNDMFIYTLHPCLRHVECQSVSDLFEKNCIGNFTISNKSIATSPYKLKQNILKLHPVPGKEISFKIQQIDEFNHAINNYFMLLVQVSPINKLISSNLIASNVSIVLRGEPGSSATLTIENVQKSFKPVTLSISMDYCYPGFVYSNKDEVCVCSDNSTKTKYPGVSHCTAYKYALLSVGYWAGYVKGIDAWNYNKNETFVTSECSPILCSFRSSDLHFGLLKISHDREQLERDICRKNRCGTLCSKCCNDTSVYYNSPKYSCKSNEHCMAGIGFFLLLEIIPTTCLFLAILFFNVNLNSGSAYTMIFYIQILDSFSANAFGHLKFSYSTQIFFDVYRIMYGIANMRFFTLEKLSFCIWKGANIYDVVTLKYAVTGYAILLVLSTIMLLKLNSFYVCIRACKKCGRRNIRYSVVRSLSAFLLICYFHILHNTLTILFCTEIKTNGNKLVKKVASFDGDVICHSKEHLKYMVLPIFSMLLIAIPPLVLIMEPVVMKLSGKIKVRTQIAFFNRLRILLKPFLDSFQGCFKNNCRIFAGFYFAYRMILGEWMIVITDISTQLSYAMATIVIIIIVHVIAQPFAKPWHNKLDVFLLINLLSIIVMSYVNFSVSDTSDLSLKKDMIAAVQLVLASTPFVYFGAYLANTLIKKYKHKFYCTKVQEDQLLAESQEVIFAKIDRKSFNQSSYEELTDKIN